MRTIVICIVSVSLCFFMWSACGDTDDSGGSSLEVTISSLTAGDLVHDTIIVLVEFSGAVTLVEIYADGVEVAERNVQDSDGDEVEITWDTTQTADGAVSLVAHAIGDGAEADSGAVEVTIDNTAPIADFGIERLTVAQGEITVPLSIEEANLQTIRVANQFGDLFASEDSADSFSWDTTTSGDGVYYLHLEVVDTAGNTGQITDFPVVVANNGAEMDVTYAPDATVSVPADYATTEYHTRTTATMEDGVERIISWLTWDAGEGWLMEYTVGEGICPHRGIAFLREESRTGEIIIDLARADLPPDITSLFPADDQTSTTFPNNGDPATFGAFFGHVDPLEPADHVGESLDIEVHMVFFYEE